MLPRHLISNASINILTSVDWLILEHPHGFQYALKLIGGKFPRQ